MSFSLSNPMWRWLLPLVTFAAAAVLCWQGGKHALAAHWAESSRPANWLRAANLEPTNAEHWQKLGLYREFDFDNAGCESSDCVSATRFRARSAVAVYPDGFGGRVRNGRGPGESRGDLSSRGTRPPDLRRSGMALRQFSAEPGARARSVRGDPSRAAGAAGPRESRDLALLARLYRHSSPPEHGAAGYG